jgi:hypothetical protein
MVFSGAAQLIMHVGLASALEELWIRAWWYWMQIRLMIPPNERSMRRYTPLWCEAPTELNAFEAALRAAWRQRGELPVRPPRTWSSTVAIFAITSPQWTAMLDVDARGLCVRAEPSLRWAIGQRYAMLRLYFLSKRWSTKRVMPKTRTSGTETMNDDQLFACQTSVWCVADDTKPC